MAKAGKKTYYWDTACFIGWLDGGKGHLPEVIAGFDEVAKEVNENRAILCTSVITNTEVLQGKLTPDQAERLANLFKRRNVVQVSLDSRISQRASAIRNFYSLKKIKLSTPDAIHLATAIIYGVDEFNTTDGDGRRQRPNDLLRLNGDVAGHPLLIRIPQAIQLSLLAGIPAAIEETDVKEKSQDGVAKSPSAQLPGGGSGPPEGEAGAKAAKATESSSQSKTQKSKNDLSIN